MIPDLSISIINTNNREQTLQCLRSVFANTHRISLEIFVVDNACADGSAEAIAAEFPQAKLIRNRERLGFSTNNNLALSQATGRYLMILNDDTIVRPSAFERLVAFMDVHPRVGACGPKVFMPSGHVQPSFSRFQSPLDELVLSTFAYTLRAKQWDVIHVTETDWVGGACMLVRREAAEQAGLLDTDFDPLYVEEQEWCYRIKAAGWQIYHVPDAQIVHLGGQTTKTMALGMLVTLYRNKLRFLQKHGSWSDVLVYRSLLLGISTLRWGGWGVRRILSKGKTTSQWKMQAQLSLMRLALKGDR